MPKQRSVIPAWTRSEQIPRWFTVCVGTGFVAVEALGFILALARNQYLLGAILVVVGLIVAPTAPYWTGFHAKYNAQTGEATVGIGINAPGASLDDPEAGVSQQRAAAPESRSD